MKEIKIQRLEWRHYWQELHNIDKNNTNRDEDVIDKNNTNYNEAVIDKSNKSVLHIKSIWNYVY